MLVFKDIITGGFRKSYIRQIYISLVISLVRFK